MERRWRALDGHLDGLAPAHDRAHPLALEAEPVDVDDAVEELQARKMRRRVLGHVGHTVEVIEREAVTPVDARHRDEHAVGRAGREERVELPQPAADCVRLGGAEGLRRCFGRSIEGVCGSEARGCAAAAAFAASFAAFALAP